MTLFLVASVPLLGCGGNDAEAGEEELAEKGYRLGEPVADSSIAAIVLSDAGADTLTTAEFRTQMEAVLQQYPMIQGNMEQSRELRRSIIEQFVLSHAFEQEAERLGLQVEEARLTERLDQIRSRFETEEAFQQELAAQGLNEDTLRSALRDQLRQQLWQERITAEVADPEVTEVESYREEQAEQVSAQHILFYSPTVDSAIEARAAAVLDSIRTGADFAEMARTHSDDGTAAEGGDLGFFSRDDMVPEFSDAAFALQDSGDVTTEPVRTQFGYHLIRLTGRRTGELMDTTRARQQIVRRRQQEAMESSIENLRRSVTVRVNQDVVDVDLNEPLDI